MRMMTPALKGVVAVSSFFIAGGMMSTSIQFLPSLIAIARSSTTPSECADSAMRLQICHLTPTTEDKTFDLADPSANSAGCESYKLAAQQFSLMSKAAFASQVPIELLSVAAASYLAVHLRSLGQGTWQKWAVVAGLIASVFPFTGMLMIPIDHKIARLGGEEEKVEPYDDAPLDREAEKSNTVEFLTKWTTLNSIRAVQMLVAGGVAIWAL